MNSALLSSKKMDWCTPQDFFDRLNEEFGFVLITCDEYRLLRGNIPALPDTWWWTATPDSPKNPYVRFAVSDGALDNYSAWSGSRGVRPLCVLKSEILKSYLDGDMKKRAEAVDMMKHIAAAWNIQPEEVFEEGR